VTSQTAMSALTRTTPPDCKEWTFEGNVGAGRFADAKTSLRWHPDATINADGFGIHVAIGDAFNHH